MKLLIYFGFLQIVFAFTLGVQNIYANEVADSYQVRYERWLKQRPLPQKKSISGSQKTIKTSQAAKTLSPKLPQSLPDKIEAKIETNFNSIRQTEPKVDVIKKTSEVAPEKPVLTLNRVNSKISPSKKLAIDAREEFLNNIPKDNDQIQALLTMVDHTKVYFSINQNGPLKDLFKDERFREIYTEEMKPETRKQTYYFFKGYQDHQRNPNEPVQKSLNRNVLINRERIDSYLETTGIKSKLTRSLQGSYPKLPKPTPVEIPIDSTDSGGANLGTE